MATKCVIVSRLPDKVRYADLVSHFTDKQNGGSQIQYILYPLVTDVKKALIAFQDTQAVQDVLKRKHDVLSQRVKVQPAPKQAYQNCTAEVDPLLLATIENAEKCLEHLQVDFGLRIVRDADNDLSVRLEGSFLQIQTAQSVLDKEYTAAVQRQQAELNRTGLTATKRRSRYDWLKQRFDAPVASDVSDDDMSVASLPAMHLRSRDTSRSFVDATNMIESAELGGTDSSMSRYADKKMETENETSVEVDLQKEVGKGDQSDAQLDENSNVHGMIKAHVLDEVHRTAPVGSQESHDCIQPMKQQFTKTSTSQHPRTNAGSEKTTGSTSMARSRRDVTESSQNYVELKIDNYIIKYIYKVQKAKLAEFEHRHAVKIKVKDGRIVIRPAVEDDKGYGKALLEAKEDLLNIYRDVHSKVVKEAVTFDPSKIKRDVLEAVVLAVKRAFSKIVVFTEPASDEEIVLVGEWNHVSVAANWMREKLSLKKPRSGTSKKLHGLHSEMLLDASDKPKLMIFMDPSEMSTEQAKEYIREKKEQLSKKKQNVSEDERLTKSLPSELAEQRVNTSEETFLEQRDESAAKMQRSTAADESPWQHDEDPARWQDEELSSSASGTQTKLSSLVGRSGGIDEFFDTASKKDIAKAMPINKQMTELQENPAATLDIFPVSDSNWWEVMEMVTKRGLCVHVCYGDITKAKVEGIVSAANERLENIGGVARAIAEAVGLQFDLDCFKFVSKHGYLQDAEVVSFPVTNDCLPWKHVLMAVGPKWFMHSDKNRCEQVLRSTYQNVLNYAGHVLKLTSLALPAISTGIYDVPVEICARALYDVIQSFDGSSSLREIFVVNLDEETTDLISAIFQQLESSREEAGYETDTSSFCQEVERSGREGRGE